MDFYLTILRLSVLEANRKLLVAELHCHSCHSDHILPQKKRKEGKKL